MPECKRVFDVSCCLVVGALALLPGVAIAVAVRLSSAGPVLYRGRRLGRDGREFDLLKFRTMTASDAGPRVTSADDRRVTPVGRWLRRTKLDELPQLVNVLRGEMSIVGPRPEDPHYAAYFPAEYATVLTVRPGITGAAAVRFRHEEAMLSGSTAADLDGSYLKEILPAKLALDLEYVAHHDVRTDVSILLATLRALLRRIDESGHGPQ